MRCLCVNVGLQLLLKFLDFSLYHLASFFLCNFVITFQLCDYVVDRL